MDPLLWELAVDLGGVPAGNSSTPGTQQPVPAAGDNDPQNVAPGISMPETQTTAFQQGPFAGHSAVLQQLQLSAQQLQSSVAAALQQAQSLPAAFDQSPLAASLGLTASFNSLSNSHLAGAGSNAAAAGALKSPPLQFQPAFGLSAAAQAVARPATSHSPSSSSGGQLPDEYTEMTEQYRFKKPLNKGALAQKRFRERQKVSIVAKLATSGLPFSKLQHVSGAVMYYASWVMSATATAMAMHKLLCMWLARVVSLRCHGTLLMFSHGIGVVVATAGAAWIL